MQFVNGWEFVVLPILWAVGNHVSDLPPAQLLRRDSSAVPINMVSVSLIFKSRTNFGLCHRAIYLRGLGMMPNFIFIQVSLNPSC
jgi:hypothetical protein